MNDDRRLDAEKNGTDRRLAAARDAVRSAHDTWVRALIFRREADEVAAKAARVRSRNHFAELLREAFTPSKIG